MKRKLLSTLMLFVLFFSYCSLPVSAKEKVNTQPTTSWIAPATETTQNGIPESEIMTTNDVIIGPYFSSYNSNYKTTVDEFKTIATFKHNNKYGTSVVPMTGTVTSSTSQGSEWSGNVSFTAEIKMGILGSVKTQAGVGYKDTRTTNEAVGYSVNYDVKPGVFGHIDFFYRGIKLGGAVTTWTANTADMVKYYFTDYVYSTVYTADYVDIYSKTYDTTK